MNKDGHLDEESSEDKDPKCAESGKFGIEAGTALDGDSSAGAIFWNMGNNKYQYRISFNIGNQASIESDSSNIGGIIRDSDEFGQFSFSGIRLFNTFNKRFGLIGGLSYTEFSYDSSWDDPLDDGGVIAANLGIVLKSAEFTIGDDLQGAVGFSVAYERRDIVGDLSNNTEHVNTLLNSNGDSFNGISAQMDVALSTNQRYFIKVTNFNGADGISGLDATLVTVGIKVDGKLLGTD